MQFGDAVEGAQRAAQVVADIRLNLDGGGSTTMVIGGTRVNSPSDATGGRPVGDAIVIARSRSR